MAAFSEDFLGEDDFEAVLAIFCSYEYSVNASEGVEKIAADEEDYHICSLCFIVCCITSVYHQ